jgi:mono/diheme cytochrome c family protein
MDRKFLFTAAALLLAVSTVSWAQEQDGASIYKQKCASCHGASGEGKGKGKAPALKTTTMSEDTIVSHIMKGDMSKDPHRKPIPGLTEDQAKAVAQFVKSLQ